jgi:sigma-B regulation protein RsbU (phosphoserine phosphatase)
MEARPATMPCLCFVTADDGTVLEVNEFLCRALGFDATELTGKRTDVFFPIATRIFQQTHLFPLLRMQGTAEEIFVMLRTRNGDDLPVLLNAVRQEEEGMGRCHYAGIIVRHRKEFEEELIAARKAAEAALQENTALQQARKELQLRTEELDHRMEQVNRQNNELRQFSRVVTHDVQEPLRKVQVFSNMLLEEGAQTEQHPLVEKLRRVTGQLRDVIQGLQQYVWLNEAPLRKTPIELERLLCLVVSVLEPEFPGVRLQLDVPAGILLNADREQMQWLFHQLLHNALRFRSDPDSVRVEIRADCLQRNRFRNVEDKYKYESHLRLQLVDDGRGFDPTYATQAFELFRRYHPESGRGTGLALCRKIMDHHDGSIVLDSQPGQGTTVTLLLPEVELPLTAFEKPRQETNETPSDTPR